MSDTVTISRNRAERVHLFLNEFAEYGYRFGLPKDLMELVGDCLIGEDTHASAWGIEDQTKAPAVITFGPEGSRAIPL